MWKTWSKFLKVKTKIAKINLIPVWRSPALRYIPWEETFHVLNCVKNLVLKFQIFQIPILSDSIWVYKVRPHKFRILNVNILTYRVDDAGISEREFHSTFFESVRKNNFISVIWIFSKSTTSWHCCCCPVMISHNAFIHTNHLEIYAVRYAFQFRWLNIKGIDAAFPIFIMLF